MNQSNRQFRFEGEQYANRVPQQSSGRTTVMAGLVIKLSGGLIKNQAQATVAMIGIIIVCFVLALIIILSLGQEPVEPNPDVPYQKGSHIIDDRALTN